MQPSLTFTPLLAHMHPNRDYSRADLTAAAGISAVLRTTRAFAHQNSC